MIIPADAWLGQRYAGQKIGYRVLNLDRSVFTAWTTERVIEDIPGHYLVAGGASAPDAGGYIVWGTRGQDVISGSIKPAPPDNNPALIDTLTAMLADLALRIINALPVIPEPAPVVVNTSAFESGVVALRGELIAMLQRADHAQTGRLAEIREAVATALVAIHGLDRLNETAHQFQHLDDASRHLNEQAALSMKLLDAQASVVGMREAMQGERAKQVRTVAIIDDFLARAAA